jgi:hypothetical protein
LNVLSQSPEMFGVKSQSPFWLVVGLNVDIFRSTRGFRFSVSAPNVISSPVGHPLYHLQPLPTSFFFSNHGWLVSMWPQSLIGYANYATMMMTTVHPPIVW